VTLDFPVWLRAAHWINVFFLGFLIRSGIQILGAYPRLYWNDHSTPGTEWFKFAKRPIPTDRPWITLEQERDVSAWLGQPGGNNLGLGRHWHFSAALFWVLNGVVYVVLLFATGEWPRLIPTSWSIFPDAWQTLLTYLSLHQPAPTAGLPYDPLQQLAYAAVVFLLGPFLILTGAAQSPGIEAQFPRYARLFGGRQGARSLHFLGLLAFVLFIVAHTFMVIVTGFSKNMGDIIFGQHQTDQGLAVIIGLALIASILAIYAVTSWGSRRWPRTAQHVLGPIIRPLMRALAVRTRSRQHYPPSSISPEFLVNGAPPETAEYRRLVQDGFSAWRLEIYGLVETPLSLTLADLHQMPVQTQITKHHCVQGWSGIAEWGGVPLGAILEACRPLSTARFLILYSYQLDTSGRPFYESLDISLGRHPQTILADQMNGRPLPVPHGAPLRLRVETELGFKMVKWLRGIEFVAEYRDLGAGQGGSREDTMFYEQPAGI
jgi:methionine sulfoxide reductase catalytic subunit